MNVRQNAKLTNYHLNGRYPAPPTATIRADYNELPVNRRRSNIRTNAKFRISSIKNLNLVNYNQFGNIEGNFSKSVSQYFQRLSFKCKKTKQQENTNIPSRSKILPVENP